MSRMETETTAASRDGLDTPVTRLTSNYLHVSPVQLLQETLEYTTSPKNYLVRRLGKHVIEQRSQLLNIPAELVDKDTYGMGPHKQRFEQHIATLLGKKHGLYFITGVQAQLASIKIWCERASKDRVAWHCLSHLETGEDDAYTRVFNLQRIFLGKSQLEVPTVADVEAITSLPAEERPAVILLELPNRELGCKTYPYNDLVQISQLCKAANIKLHMDGARLWEIQPFYHKPFADIAQLFDSVYVGLYKGLHGTVGCMLTSSDTDFMTEAKKWQRRLGGNMVTSYPAVIDCERGYNLNIGSFHLKWQKMCSVVPAVMEATKEYRTKDGKPIIYFNPEVPTCSQIHTHIQGVTAERLAAVRDEVERKHHINVFHWTKPWEFLDEMDAGWMLVKRGADVVEEGTMAQKERTIEDLGKYHQLTEWSITDENLYIGDDIFAQGWKILCHLIAIDQ